MCPDARLLPRLPLALVTPCSDGENSFIARHRFALYTVRGCAR